jgi:transcriptional regulator with GAF, ATPase, and Fis domain
MPSATTGCCAMWPRTSWPEGSGSDGREIVMRREADVVQSLVDLADTLVADYDIVDLLTGLANRCVDVLGASAAGVMLASASGDLRLVASSSEAMRVLELFELQAHEGPCLDAFRTGERVEHESLRGGTGRWPRFSTVALEAGFRSAFALPLRLRDTTIGALNLVSVDEAPMDESDALVARAFADLATISVLQQRAVADSQLVNEQLTHALTSRLVIEQAKGVVFERAGVDMSEAFARLRTYARNHNLRLTDVAQAAVDGTLAPEAWATPSGSRSSPSNRS